MIAAVSREGWTGWDEYAPFYDWENARTLGRRDVPFWRRIASAARGTVLELGCGTGRVSLPLARAGVHLVGIDRSAPMLARARRRIRNRQSAINPQPAINPQSTINRESAINPQSAIRNPQFVRGDIRALPFRARSFAAVIAPYGILQSLTRPRDLTSTLAS